MNQPRDEELDRLLATGGGAESTGDHPDDAVLLDYAANSAAGAQENSQLEAHLAACTECRTMWREMYAQLDRAPLDQKERSFLRRRSVLAGAAAVAASAALVWLIPAGDVLPAMELDPLPPGLSAVRGEAGREIPRYHPRTPLELTLRSERVWSEWSYTAALFSAAPGEDPVRVDTATPTVEGKTLRFVIEAGDLGSGERELSVVITGEGAEAAFRRHVAITAP